MDLIELRFLRLYVSLNTKQAISDVLPSQSLGLVLKSRLWKANRNPDALYTDWRIWRYF